MAPYRQRQHLSTVGAYGQQIGAFGHESGRYGAYIGVITFTTAGAVEDTEAEEKSSFWGSFSCIACVFIAFYRLLKLVHAQSIEEENDNV